MHSRSTIGVAREWLNVSGFVLVVLLGAALAPENAAGAGVGVDKAGSVLRSATADYCPDANWLPPNDPWLNCDTYLSYPINVDAYYEALALLRSTAGATDPWCDELLDHVDAMGGPIWYDRNTAPSDGYFQWSTGLWGMGDNMAASHPCSLGGLALHEGCHRHFGEPANPQERDAQEQACADAQVFCQSYCN